MTITPLSAIPAIPAGTNLEAIEICLQKIDPAPSPFGQGTKQGSFAQDASGSKLTVQFIDFDPLTPDWVGPWMRIEAGRNGKGDYTGIEVDEYPAGSGKKRLRIRGGTNNDGSPKTVLTWLDGIPAAPTAAPARQAPPPRHSGPPHRDDIVYDTHPQQAQQRLTNPPPRPAGPPPQAARQPSPPPAPPNRPPVPAGPHGATVGMAVKEAFSALMRGVRPEAIAEEIRNPSFWQDVHQTASELLHVCKALETGDIAPSIVTSSAPDFTAEEAAAQNEPWPND